MALTLRAPGPEIDRRRARLRKRKPRVRFDDRLMTVLDQPAIDPHDRAVRWRQLVDLVARAGAQADNPLVEQALQLVRSDRAHVDEKLRSAAARAIASLPLPFELVALFATDSLAVSAPIRPRHYCRAASASLMW